MGLCLTTVMVKQVKADTKRAMAVPWKCNNSKISSCKGLLQSRKVLQGTQHLLLCWQVTLPVLEGKKTQCDCYEKMNKHWLLAAKSA